MTDFKFATLDEPFEADWPVRVSVAQDGGTVKVETFTARLRLLTETDTDEMEADPKLTDVAGETLRRAFVGFGKATGETFTPALRDKLIRTPYVRRALLAAYQEFAQGSPAKN